MSFSDRRSVSRLVAALLLFTPGCALVSADSSPGVLMSPVPVATEPERSDANRNDLLLITESPPTQDAETGGDADGQEGNSKEDDDSGAPDLLDFLLKNGAITQEQYDELRDDPRYKPAEEGEVRPIIVLDDSGFKVKVGKHEIKIGGRMHIDGATHDKNTAGGQDITDGTEIRRARLAVSGKLEGGWFYMGEADFADNLTAIKDFLFGIKYASGNKFILGHQKQPYSLALEMSSNDIPFAERGVDEYLTVPIVDRAVGGRYETVGENTFFAGGIYGEGAGPSFVEDEGWGGASRFVYTPVLEEDKIVHMGIRGAYRVPGDSTNSIRIRDETTHFSNFRVVNTGFIEDVDSIRLYGAEAAYANGPFSLVSAVNRMNIDRDGQNLTFNSWGAEATYTLTGESRAETYNLASGEFKRLKVADKATGLDPTSGGAWELAARFSNLDANDRFIQGGEEDVFTGGLNWYPNDFTRFLFNWSHILDTRGPRPQTDDAEGMNIYQIRIQFLF